MSHEHLPVELLSAFLDGETTPAERQRVDAHLAACPACLAELEDLRRIAEASAKIAVPEVPGDLRRRISAATRPSGRSRAWIGAAASLAAVGLVATAWYLQGPPRLPQVPAPVAAPAPAPAPAPTATEGPRVDALGYLGKPAGPPPPPPAPDRRDASSSKQKVASRESEERQRALLQKKESAESAAEPPLERDVAAEEAPVDESKYAADRAGDPGGVEGGVAGGVVGGVMGGVMGGGEAEALAPPPPAPSMRRANAGSAERLALEDADRCGTVSFVEAAVDVAPDRASLEAALRRAGVEPQPETRRGILEVIVPRSRWEECRTTLAQQRILVDPRKVDATGGRCVGVSIRVAVP